MAESEWRRILRARLRPAPVGALDAGPSEAVRVQKNLSLKRRDADRIAALARRHRMSQARLIEAALDCYERIYGAHLSGE